MVKVKKWHDEEVNRLGTFDFYSEPNVWAQEYQDLQRIKREIGLDSYDRYVETRLSKRKKRLYNAS